MWLAFAGGILIALGAAVSIRMAGGARSTPPGLTPAAIVAATGIVLTFPGIFVDAGGDETYWNASGHSLGIVMLILAILAALAWAATVSGAATHGLDVALVLLLFGITAFNVIGSAFNDFGSLGTGAWLAFVGGLLAAVGTWAARGMEMPRAAAAPV
jgi:hypothetical protein